MEASHDLVKLFGLRFNLKIMIMTWITMAIITVIAWLASRKVSLVPNSWQSIGEMLVEMVQNMLRESMGEIGIKYTYFFGSLFLFILVSNMLGLIPLMASPTRDVSVTLALAFLWLVWAQYIAIRENGIGNYFKHFFQPVFFFAPIHLMEMLTRPLTLALRLFGNIFAGEILLEQLTHTFKILVPSVWIAMSILIGAIQAYIFTVLTVSYTGLSVSHEDHTEHSH